MKKGIIFFVIMALCVMSCPNQSFAYERPVRVDSETFYEMHGDKYDINNQIDLSTCEKVPDYIQKVLDENINVNQNQDQSILSTWSIGMGKDDTFSGVNDGGAYCHIWSGTEEDGDYLYDWGSDLNYDYGGWADAKTYLISTLGSGDTFEGASVAWTGNEIKVEGTQAERDCRVTFLGDYYGYATQLSNARAFSKIILRIVDRSDNNNTLLNTVINSTPSGTINHYADVTLEKDHIYEFQMMVWAEGHVSDPITTINASVATTNYWSNGLEGYGLDYAGVAFDWQ